MPAVSDHPNALAAGGTTGAGALAIWLLTSVFHVSISAPVGVTIAGTVTTLFLILGRRGVEGIWKTVWKGTDPAAGTPVPPLPPAELTVPPPPAEPPAPPAQPAAPPAAPPAP